jgi:hypothetical protein
MPGAGTRLTLNSIGFAVATLVKRMVLPHPFRPALSSGGVTLSRGLVQNIEPKIKGVPIGGSFRTPQPVLALDSALANDAGESWVCVELSLRSDGTLPEKNPRVEIVHSKQPESHSLILARCPLVMILWQGKQPLRAEEIVYFNLRYQRLVPPEGAGVVRHIFY